jgi:hypothetical protein
MQIGDIDNTCVVLVTMDKEKNEEIADEVLSIPGYDESKNKLIDFDGFDFIEEEEIHFVMVKNPKTSGQDSDKKRDEILESIKSSEYMDEEEILNKLKSNEEKVITKHQSDDDLTKEQIMNKMKSNNAVTRDDILDAVQSTKDRKREEALDRLQSYMASQYPDTYTKSFKVLYGENPDRLERFVNTVDADFLAVHKDSIDSKTEYEESVSVPLVFLGD